MFSEDKIYSLNPDYILRHDVYRSYLFSTDRPQNDSSPNWESLIHPLQAAILSFFTHGQKLKNILQNLSDFLCMTKQETIEMIKPYIENTKEFHTQLGRDKFNFPKKLIIAHPKTRKEHFPKNFEYDKLDFSTKRFFGGPSSITLMLTNACTTKCIYCYANIEYKVKKHISLDRIKTLIKEANSLNCYAVDIIGGEVMLYPQWKELIKYLASYNFLPEVISTKIPVKEEDIIFLKNNGISFLQISLDTANEKLIKKNLQRSDAYLKKMQSTFKYCQKHKINIQIAATLIKNNSDFSEINKLLDFIQPYTCIQNIDFGPAFYSLYRDKDKNFNSWGINKEDYQNLIKKVKKIEKNYHFTINFDTSALEKQFYKDKEGSSNFKGAACSANNSHLFILPDGKATICEQLYWTEEFIVGDLNTQSIKEVWNSHKSLKLANLKQEYFPKASACASCSIFDKCHENVNKCWADILKAYGKDKWYYPDPRCAYAPKIINTIAFDYDMKIKTENLI